MRSAVALLLLFLLLPTQARSASEKAPGKKPAAVRLRLRPYPSLRFGSVLRMDFHLKVQGDFRTFSPSLPGEDLFELNRLRLGVEGRFLKHFKYEAEREIREEASGGRFENPRHPWRDAYVDFDYFKHFQIQAGKFKIPFSREQLTSAAKLDLIYRSRVADNLAPGRDIGIVAHGDFFHDGFGYEAGFFRHDGENSRVVANEIEHPSGLRTFAARITGKPLRLLPLPEFLQGVQLGGALTASNVTAGVGEAGAKGLRGKTVTGETFFPHAFVDGRRLRAGVELHWVPGPFSLSGEFIHGRDERREQSLRAADLPLLLARGWYLTGTWVATGEKRAGGVEPRRQFITGSGMGAIELAIRYDQLRFGSSEHPGLPARGPRSANILGNSDRVWTFGINWYWNRHVRVQLNGIRERIEDPVSQRSPIDGIPVYWMGIARLQLAL